MNQRTTMDQVASLTRAEQALQELTETEKRQLLVNWNDTKREYSHTKCIHQLFEEQTERSPDAVAVVFENQQTTYRELNATANRIAYSLAEKGVGRGSFVPFLMDRSIEVPIAMLAIMKAGAAFVPLDIHWPVERIKQILEDLRSEVILVNQTTPYGQEAVGCPFLHVNEQTAIDAAGMNPNLDLDSGEPIYTIYTSGSTGKPKGAVIPHRGIINRFLWMNEFFGPATAGAALQTTHHVYDSAVWQLFWPLINGGTSIIPASGMEIDAEYLADLIYRNEVTITDFVPSVFNTIVPQLVQDATLQKKLQSLRTIIVGGEEITPSTTYTFMAQFPTVRVMNLYGPTEASIGCICYEVTGKEGGKIPIGRPISNVHALVLDKNKHLVPIGVAGELYLSGRCLGLGYLNDEEKTKDVFVDNPFPEIPYSKLYRTGDLVSYLSDGNIQFLGRLDHQVKIRGFRVELGEIETAMRAHPGVREALVVAQDKGRLAKSLVGYIVADQGTAPTAAELRLFLKRKLPEYMVPSWFVSLASLPRTPNGKIDRKALPEPEERRPESEESYVSPRTPVEEMIAEIWAEVLKLDTIAIHDNFFDLGGHSLLATQVISRTRRQLQVELPLRVLFENPTVPELARHIEQARQEDERPSTPSIVPVPRDKDLPLSFAQQRLWFFDQYEPNSSAYNIYSALRLTGVLKVSALEQSLKEIVKRHESLRTTFAVLEGEPVQVIAPSLDHALRLVDLREIPSSDREEHGRGICEEEARQPFDLSQGPLFRSTLIRLGEDDHILLLTLHHIVSDGWSLEVLYGELAVLYRAYSRSQASPLSPLAIQYADFTVRQKEWMAGQVLERQVSYWRKQLAGVPEVLNLPTDRPRPTVQSYRGARRTFELSKELTHELKALSRSEGVTLFMTLVTAFQTLLYRYTGQEDIVVGSAIANRKRSEIEGLIGLFVNTLVLRTTIRNNPTFRDLLGQVKETALQAYAHQDLPFEKLVEELQPRRNLTYSPLVQVMFILHNTPSYACELEDLTLSQIELDNKTAKLDLILALTESDGIRGSLEYNTDLFDAATIDRLGGHFRTLLKGIVAEPQRSIGDLSILTQAERHRLLVEWNDTKRDYLRDGCLHQLFEEQMARTPYAVAVVFEEKKLTYEELNQRANRVARDLQKRGVRVETMVGICAERSLEMIVGVLGILKAGGAYVPLDPRYPKERLAFMLEDTAAPVLLAQSRLIESLPAFDGQIVWLDDVGETTNESTSNIASGMTADNLAYVIYTSGSTGKPKAVQVLHHAVVNLLSHMRAALDWTDHDRLLSLANICFDMSAPELFLPLCMGGRIIVASADVVVDGGRIGALIASSGATLMQATPATWHLLLQAGWKGAAYLRLIAGGEALASGLAGELMARGASVWNLYGPTETTVWSSAAKLHVEVGEANISVGRPIANTQIYILDDQLEPVPIGAPGHVHIGGAGVARGYLNRPYLTAEKFIPDPFSGVPGARLYRTGDVARYLPSGNIDFLGRLDHQVKIRGFRVELGEVESVLNQHPAVRESVAVVRGDSPGDKNLVAYVVPKQRPVPTASDLRNFAKQKLPDWMVPAAFVVLDTLPLTSNRKVDRNALPAPDQSRPELEECFVAPRTPVEEIIVEIWAEVLKLDTVGIHDNFFDLGGHSLLATQVMSRIYQVLKTELTLRALFEGPTVAALAQRIEEVRSEETRLPAQPLVSVPRDKDLPLSFSQQRLWFLDQYEPNSSVYNIPSAFRLTGSLNIGALEQSLSEIVRRHESLRTTFSMVDWEPVQLITPSGEFSLSMVDLSEDPEGEREERAQRFVDEDARRPFDLARGPLFRASLIRLGEDDHIFLLTLHHIVSDGWSMGVLHRELSVLYEAFSRAEPSPLSELPIQYADYAVWQREWLKGEELDRHLSYWKKQLEGIPAVLNLPTDHPRPTVESYRGARQSIELSKKLSEELKALSRREGVTLFLTLLAALQTLLYRYTGQEDIVVGSPIANRNRSEIEGLIGFFINTVPLRSRFSGKAKFKELLSQVRETALAAYAHQDLSFEKLVEEINPERNVNHTPLFQVLFNMVVLEGSKLDLPGLTVEPISSSQSESKFDLTLYVGEVNGQVRFNLVYKVDLFSQPRMTCFLQQYKYLLEQIAAGAEEAIESYSLVTPESHSVLPDPSRVLPEPEQDLVTNSFSAWSSRAPGQPAVSQGKHTWSYGELAQQAENVARVLRARGLERGEVVAVCGPRSFGLICSMAGVFLSGGVLLTVDPNLPDQRKQLMLGEAGAKILLNIGREDAQSSLLERKADLTVLFVGAANGCCVVDESLDLARVVLPELAPDDPAYIFFTSGSTGTPKAVLGCHKGLSHFLRWQRETFAIGPQDRVAQLTNLSFDPVLRDIFLPLSSGAVLCLPEEADTLTPYEILPWLESERISVLHTVPTLAQSWLADGGTQVCLKRMRWVFFAGEPLTENLVRRWRATFPESGGEIVNLYGPSETTLAKCFYRVPADISAGVQPVGWPLPEAQALVLGETHQPCGIGEPGEIVLRTPYRTLGYINAPDENRRRFVKNPVCDDERDLLYYTGDRGRYRPDGTLEILGRLDDQVKIRGVRVEPDEVTAALAQHPEVKASFVVARQDDQDQRYLVAYVLPSEKDRLTARQLRSYLQTQLPLAMIPTTFVFVDQLPLTPNGKVDRKALPKPEVRRPELEKSYVAPRTNMEEMIVEIWTEVLKVDTVGIHDNFFDLGGHSLLVTQVVSRIRNAMQMELSLRGFFEKPTVAGLAEHLETIQWISDEKTTTAKNDLGAMEKITL